jgi:uncharacterized protein
MLDSVSAFDWDPGNWHKCAEHGVSQAEIEFVLRGELRVFPDLPHSSEETRFLGIGRDSTGRYAFIAFTLRERDAQRLVRPISARYMHDKEVRHYEAQVRVPPQTAEDEVGSAGRTVRGGRRPDPI